MSSRCFAVTALLAAATLVAGCSQSPAPNKGSPSGDGGVSADGKSQLVTLHVENMT
jgi:hypothetical protein